MCKLRFSIVSASSESDICRLPGDVRCFLLPRCLLLLPPPPPLPCESFETYVRFRDDVEDEEDDDEAVDVTSMYE